tara:strand:+ start:452 stop:676 length:225 start_codon:yes stop_codon:yes gene_type:complete
MKSINPKNQKLVNKSIKWLLKYNDYNTQRNICDSNGDEKGWNKLNKKCESSYDKYLESLEVLPKREIQNIENNY